MPRWSNALLFLGTLVSCTLSLELGFRAVGGVPVFSIVDWRHAHLVQAEAGPSVAIYDPKIGWTMLPGYASADMNLIDYGIRKNHASDATIRTGGVLVVGDSFAAGSQVNDDETWPAGLEALIGEPVINAAVGGYGVDQMVLRAEQLMPVVRPKTLIIGTQDQGILRVKFSSYGRPKPYFSLEDGALVPHNDPAPRYAIDPRRESVIRRVFGYSYLADQIMGIYFPDHWYTQEGQRFVQAKVDDVQVTCRLLERAKSDADRAGLRLLLLIQYGGVIARMTEPSPFAKNVGQCARAVGIQTVDEFDSLHAIAVRNIEEFKKHYVMVDDPAQPYGHMSALGNRHIAGLLAAALRGESAEASSPRQREAERMLKQDDALGGPAAAKDPGQAGPALDTASMRR